MTNQEILKIAMAQSAIDLCAEPEDFEKSENVVVMSHKNEGARRYLQLPFSCQLVSYGNNVVASVSPEFFEITENYINKSVCLIGDAKVRRLEGRSKGTVLGRGQVKQNRLAPPRMQGKLNPRMQGKRKRLQKQIPLEPHRLGKRINLRSSMRIQKSQCPVLHIL